MQFSLTDAQKKALASALLTAILVLVIQAAAAFGVGVMLPPVPPELGPIVPTQRVPNSCDQRAWLVSPERGG